MPYAEREAPSSVNSRVPKWAQPGLSAFMSGPSASEHESSGITRSSSIGTSPRKVRHSDQRLLGMAVDASNHIDWDQLTGPRPTAEWARRRGERKLELFTREHRRGVRDGSFAVLARQELPCTVKELWLLYQRMSSEIFRGIMVSINPKDYVYAEVLHQVDMEALRGYCPLNQPHYEVADAAVLGLPELYVEATTFDTSTFFRTLEEWCYIDFLQPITEKTNNGRPGFTKIMVPLAREDCLMDRGITGGKLGHSTVAGFRFEEAAGDSKATRVVFFAEFTAQSSESSIYAKNNNAPSKTVKARLEKMATSMHRLFTVIQRRRLGMQVLVDAACIINPPNAHCICCVRPFRLTRRRLCALCGYTVCDRCSRIIEREHFASRHTPRPLLHDVRVCERCMKRVNNCDYATVTFENMQPFAVLPDPPKTANNSKMLTSGAILASILADTMVSGDNTQKASAQSLTKYLAGANAKHLMRSSNARNEDQVYMDVLKAYVQADTPYPLEKCIIANNKKRSYQLPFPDDPELPILFGPTPYEHERMSSIDRMGLRSLRPVADLDLIAVVASRALNCLGGIVAILHKDDYHIIACNLTGVANTWLELKEGICGQMLRTPHPLAVNHARADVRCSKVKWVSRTGVTFYCGFPFQSEDNTTIGSVCCVDEETRTMSQSQYGLMVELAKIAAKIVTRESKAQLLEKASAKQW